MRLSVRAALMSLAPGIASAPAAGASPFTAEARCASRNRPERPTACLRLSAEIVSSSVGCSASSRSAAWRTGSGKVGTTAATPMSAKSGASPPWRAAELCTDHVVAGVGSKMCTVQQFRDALRKRRHG